MGKIFDEALGFFRDIKTKPEVTTEVPSISELEEKLGELYPKRSIKESPPEQKAASTIKAERPPSVHLATSSETGPTTEEIVAYHNRKIGKHLGALEGHYADRMRIFGKPCDCGSSKHLLFLEQFSEETISMVDNPSIYEEIIQWVREVEPKSTDTAAKSGKYDDEYLVLSRQARDFRKKLLGTTALSAMIESKAQISLTPATIALLATTEDNPIKKFCCRQCSECAPSELLQDGKFPERIDWLREHYAEKHPGIWGK